MVALEAASRARLGSLRYEFTGAKIQEFPLPSDCLSTLDARLDPWPSNLSHLSRPQGVRKGVPTRDRSDDARAEHARIPARMIALQEELDWDVYRRYGLLTERSHGTGREARIRSGAEVGERAFEIVLARRVESGELETQWFARHRSTPITRSRALAAGVPGRGREADRDDRAGPEHRADRAARVQAAMAVRAVGGQGTRSASRTGCWTAAKTVARYGRTGIPAPMTVNRLADQLRADADVVSVARLLAGPDADLADVSRTSPPKSTSPPGPVPLQASGPGQARPVGADLGPAARRGPTGQRLDIPVPPKYKNTDFRKNSYWRQRGKLDVPKERFISYPGASPDSDDSLLLGWAGWDHREQAHALTTLIEERSTTDGWDAPPQAPPGRPPGGNALGPPMAHGRRPPLRPSPADAYDAYLTAQRENRSLTEDASAPGPHPVRQGRSQAETIRPLGAGFSTASCLSGYGGMVPSRA